MIISYHNDIYWILSELFFSHCSAMLCLANKFAFTERMLRVWEIDGLSIKYDQSMDESKGDARVLKFPRIMAEHRVTEN